MISRPPIITMHFLPEVSLATAASMRLAGTGSGVSRSMAGSAPLGLSPHDTSAGSISVATRPLPACRTASAASRAISAGAVEVCTQCDTGPRDTLDIRRQRCVVLHMVGGVIADDIDDGHMTLFGIVDIGQRIAQAGTEVQQRRRGLARHAGIAVRSAAEHTLEQAQHTAHALHFIQRRHEMHLRCTGIGETHLDAIIDQGGQ